jgi:HK97 family phage portal protein
VAAEEHAGAYFAGGALPPAVLQSPQILTQPQAAELKASWRTMVNTREPVVLPTGYVLTPIVSDALNAQLVESRQWNAADIAMILGIPSYKLGLAGPSMTYQNIESADIEFVRDSVDRYAKPLSAAFSEGLMPAGTDVAWDYAGRMRADQTTTETVLAGYVGSGILTVDEARAAIGRPPLEASTDENGTPEDVPELTPDEIAQAPEQVTENV